jgi:hypothetical protein
VGATSSELTEFGDEHRWRLRASVKKSGGLAVFLSGEKERAERGRCGDLRRGSRGSLGLP